MMFLNRSNIDLILFWDRIVYVGVVFIPVSMLSFGFTLVNQHNKKTQSIIAIGYFISSIFFSLIPTNLFLGVAYVYSWGAHSKALMFHNVFLVYFSVYISLWFIYIFRYYLSLHVSIEKERIKYALIAFIQFALLGPLGFLAAYGINIYPFSYISGLIFTIIIGYSIVSYHLMDIKLVLRKSIVYLSSLFVTTVLVFALKYLIGFVVNSLSYWFDFILIVVALGIFPPLHDYFFRVANKYFFTSLYDSKKVISDLSEELASTLEPHRICQAVEKYLTAALHPKSLAILDYSVEQQVFDVKFNYGFKFKQGDIKINKIILNNYFAKNDVVLLDDLKNKTVGGLGSFLKEYSERLGVDVIVPMILKSKIVGFIALGAKESGDAYNNEDVELLSVVGTQVAMSLENSWLYEETRTFNLKLTREVELATKDLQTANEELKRLDEAKSEFISIASHQLRTPLTVIKGYSSMMMEGSFGQMTPPIEENIKKIYESNERLIALVEDLLNISRIESGRLKFDFVVESLESVTDSVIEELSEVAKKKGLVVNYEKQANLPAVKIDKNKIRQVVINITDNAIKYTNQGEVKIKLEVFKNMVRYSVTDTGMGISKEDMPHLFQKFSRGQDVSLIHTEGTGLGLYVGKMMIEAHNGKIWAESAGDGKGSTFIFEIPIAKNT